MVLDLDQTAGPTPMPLTSNLVPTVLLLVPGGTLLRLLLIRMATVILLLVVLEVVLQTHLLAALVMDSGVTANMSRVLPTLALSVSSLVFKMTQPSNKLVLISRSTMTFQSRLPDTMFQSQFSSLPTLLLMTTYSRISNLPITRFLRQYKNTLSLSS